MPGHVARVKAQLTLQSQRRLLSELEGEFVSVRTGAGTDFHDLREYVRGDEIKHIDWKASARTGAPQVRRFSSVRKQTVLLAVSTGRSMAAMHTLQQTKIEAAAEVAGLVGWLALRQSDLVGVVYGDASAQRTVRPGTSEVELEQALGAAAAATRDDGAPADTAAVLRHLVRGRRRRAIVLLVCDDEVVTPELGTALRRVSAQHDLLVVTPGDVDPVTVPVTAPLSVDVDSAWSLPAWVREDPLLGQELHAVRAAARVALHADLARIGIAHEHLEPGTTSLACVRRLLVRHRHARAR